MWTGAVWSNIAFAIWTNTGRCLGESKVGGALAFALLGSALGWETHTKNTI